MKRVIAFFLLLIFVSSIAIELYSTVIQSEIAILFSDSEDDADNEKEESGKSSFFAKDKFMHQYNFCANLMITKLDFSLIYVSYFTAPFILVDIIPPEYV